MNADDILLRLLNDSTLVPQRNWVEAMALQYPAFTLPAILLLQRDATLSREEREKWLLRVALLSGNRASLGIAVDDDARELATTFADSEAEPAPTTQNTIEGFLDRYSTADHNREADVLERLIFNPTPPDYLSLIEKEQDDPSGDGDTAPAQSEQDALIDAFIEAHPEESAPKKKKQAAAAAPLRASFSESLADDYIRQKNYTKAYEILNAINRSDSPHSPYLADRLRYLSRLISLTNPTL